MWGRHSAGWRARSPLSPADDEGVDGSSSVLKGRAHTAFLASSWPASRRPQASRGPHPCGASQMNQGSRESGPHHAVVDESPGEGIVELRIRHAPVAVVTRDDVADEYRTSTGTGKLMGTPAAVKTRPSRSRISAPTGRRSRVHRSRGGRRGSPWQRRGPPSSRCRSSVDDATPCTDDIHDVRAAASKQRGSRYPWPWRRS